MEDFLYVLVMVAFTVIAVLFVIFCDRLIGRDDEALAEEAARGGEELDEVDEEVAA